MGAPERRKYVRLNKIFPVELKILDLHKKPISDLLQGFTRDVSFEGVCVEINNFPDGYVELLQKKKAQVALFLNIPFKKDSIKAVGRLAWSKKTATPYPRSYLLGLAYDVIDREEQKRIMHYAKISTIVPRALTFCAAFLLLFLFYLFILNVKLTHSNRFLVHQLTELSEERSCITEQLDKIATEKVIIGNMLQRGTNERRILMEKIKMLENEKDIEEQKQNIIEVEKLASECKGLHKQLNVLLKEKAFMEEKLKHYTYSQESLKTKLAQIVGERIMLQDKTLNLMRRWLYSAQSSKTGLVVSYDNDSTCVDAGFTYDQALSALNFIQFQDYEKAAAIFDFYQEKAKKVKGGFANAYDVITGRVSEYIVHSGPSIYLGVAMVEYADKTGDKQYLSTVYEIGNWLLALQEGSGNGALPGGPQLDWVSTEQNIAVFIFFQRLYTLTRDKRYAVAGRRILGWIKNHGYNRALKRLNRGSDDPMIATDTIALSIMAFGPKQLHSMGIDVNALVSSAEEHCKVTVRYRNAFGKLVTVTGYDFCSPTSLGREGVISVEWTAQMVIAYQQLNMFYAERGDEDKAQWYAHKADFYLGELEKLVLIRSGIGKKKGSGGLPYATSSKVSTGHGWFTPNSASISAAATNFAIFAKQEYNIFSE